MNTTTRAFDRGIVAGSDSLAQDMVGAWLQTALAVESVRLPSGRWMHRIAEVAR